MAFGAPIAEEFVRIRADTQGFKGEATSGVTGSLKGIAAGAAGVFAGLKVFDFVKDSVIGFNSTLEQSRTAFKVLLGGIEPANAMLAKLQDFAKTTPFAFEQLIPVAQQLVGALGKSTNVTQVMTELGDAISATGGSAAKLDQLTLAYTQLATSGVARMGDLNQINNAVPGALSRMAQAAGVSVGDFRQKVGKGMVSSAEAVKLFHKVTTDPKFGIAGGMAEQSKTFAGAMSNIGDALQQGLAGLGAPIFEFVSTAAKGFAQFLSVWQGAGFEQAVLGAFGGQGVQALHVFQAVFSTLVAAVSLGVQALGAAFGFVASHADTIGSAFSAVVSAATAVFDVVNGNRELFGAIAAGIAIATVALFGIAAAMIVGTAVSTAFGVALAFAFSPITIIVVTIGLLIAAVILLYRHNETARALIDGAWAGIKSIIMTTIGVIRTVITTFVTVAMALWSRFGGTIVTITTAYFGIIRSVITGVLGVIRGVVNVVLGLIHGDFGRVWNGIKQIVSGVMGALGGIIRGAFTIVKAAATALATLAFDAIKAGFGKIPGAIGTILRGIPGALGDVGHLLYNIGRDIVQGLIDGIGSMFGAVRDKLGNLTSSLTSWKGPPARDRVLLRPAGRSIIDGLVDGLTEQIPTVHRTLADLTGAIAGLRPAGVPLTPAAAVGGGSTFPGTGGPQITIHGGVTVSANDPGGFVDGLLTAAAEAARR